MSVHARTLQRYNVALHFFPTSFCGKVMLISDYYNR